MNGTAMLGIDTGGTYTDAVLVDHEQRVLRSAKALTTPDDLSRGVGEALSRVLSGEPPAISLVSLSTTLATNALVEGNGRPFCLLLVGYTPDALERAGLRGALDGNPVVFVAGGHDAAGNEQAPLDRDAIGAAIAAHQSRVAAFAVSAFFAVRNPAHEIQAKQLIRSHSALPVTCGHELSSDLNAPRRALTTVLNARLIPLLSELISAVRVTLDRYGVRAPLMVVKGDGSLVRAEFALDSPVETILSGPAASAVGARQLTGKNDVVVMDVGGTTTDVAVLRAGMPALDPHGASVGGWRTMVRAARIHTFGLGGDSEVRLNNASRIELGPRRATPLCQLCSRYPELLRVLQAQADDPACRRLPGRFALRLRASASGGPRLSPAQRRICEMLEGGPLALAVLCKDQSLVRPLERLQRRGLVGLSGFTPTDALHVLGEMDCWVRDASLLAAGLLCREISYRTGQPRMGEQELSRCVVESVARSAAFELVSALLQEARDPVTALGPQERKLVADSLQAGAGDRVLSIAWHLRPPLIGVGAPAAAYLPAVARYLNTALEVPEHAPVANAVGAIAGIVRQRAEANVTPWGESQFRVHGPSHVRTFPSLDTAAAWAVKAARQAAVAKARRAGAEQIESRVSRVDNTVRDDIGGEVFFESRISVTAFGRPGVGNIGLKIDKKIPATGHSVVVRIGPAWRK